MKYLLGKINIAMTLLLVTSLGNVYGDYMTASSYGADANCFPCQPVCYGSCAKGFIGADLLYWRPFLSGLDTCVPTDVSDRIVDGRVISRFRGHGRNPHFDWDPGFRITAGWEFACSHWGIATSWTHFHSHVHDHDMRWNISFDQLDLVGVYEADVNSCFALRPFAGLRGAKIDQKLRIRESLSSNSSSSSSSSSDDFDSFIRNKERFSGIGPVLGVWADFNVWCDFSVYANGSISWLYGDFNIRLNEFDETVDTVDSCSVKRNPDGSLAAADIGVGIRWERCFCSDKRLILQLGLEHHRYFDYNRFDCYGDLSFDGLNFSAGFEF